MKKRFACVALSALALAAPAAAERIYVPVLGTAAADGSVLATRVRIANADGVEAPVAARFRDASGAAGLETERALKAQPDGRFLTDLSPAGRTGLITLEADSALAVSASMASRAGVDVDVPAFTDAETYSAGVDVPLDQLPRPRALRSLLVGAANLSDQTASCQATLFARDGSRSAEIQFEVPAMSLVRKDGLAAAGRGRVASARVTCDQSFYPFGVAADAGGRSIITKGIGPNGTCTMFLNLVRQQLSGNYVAETVAGSIFHDATKANPKGILCIKAPGELKIASAKFEWNVTAGPWSPRDRSGVHNLGYFFLDRYRSGTVGNVNILGPNKSILKFIQNVNMPAGSNTNAKTSYAMQTGVVYHNVYTYDAVSKLATMQLFVNGLEVAKISKDAKPGNNQTLIVKPFGQGNLAGLALIAEFGNYLGQHHPEEATVGWKYSSFRLTLVPK
jgi:hypothetical protein